MHESGSKFYKFEIQNYVLTIFDNYNNEIAYLEKYFEVVERIFSYQKSVLVKIDQIKATMKGDFSSLKAKQGELTKFYTNIDKIVVTILKIQDITDFTNQTYVKNIERDESTFGEFIFEVYYKNQIKYLKGLNPDFVEDANLLQL